MNSFAIYLQDKVIDFFREAKTLNLYDLIKYLEDELYVKRVGNRNYFIIFRLFYPSFVWVSDLIQILYCPRSLWFRYNLVPQYRYSINLVDLDGLERILRGQYVHKKIKETLNNIKTIAIPEYSVIDYNYGLVGKIDVVRPIIIKDIEVESQNCITEVYRRDIKEIEIYEIKANWKSKLYMSWVAQVGLYTYLIEKVEKKLVTNTYIITCNTIWKIKINEKLLKTCQDILEEARKILRESNPPEIKNRKKEKCRACGFQPICFRKL